MTRRFYFRCPCCLSVTASDLEERYGRPVSPVNSRNISCSLCDRDLQCMGMVSANKLITVEDRCPCDARCTNALGPSCECKCQGENHGTGLIVKVIIEHNYPKIKPIDMDKAMRIRDEYITALSQAKSRLEALPFYQDFKERRFFDNREAYRLVYYSDLHLRKIQSLKSHHVRMKKLLDFLTPKQEETEGYGNNQ